MDVDNHALGHVAGDCPRGGLYLGARALAKQESDAHAAARRTSRKIRPPPLEVLQERYARGEINTATFENMRERLGASGTRDDYL